jgi:hypothetical protein
MNNHHGSRAVFRVAAVVLGAFFVGVGCWKLIERPIEWLNLASSLVVIVIGMRLVHAGITDRLGKRSDGATGAIGGSKRHAFMTVEPIPSESQNSAGERAADFTERPVRRSETSSNPYDPPRTVADSKLGLPAKLFLAGQPFIHYGVVYFVEKGDASAIHAALPLADRSQELVDRNVHEAMRVLPEFLSSVPTLKPQLLCRQLIIRMIASYDDLNDEVTDRVIRPLAAVV